MIHLVSDFGIGSPYVGEVNAVLHRALTHQQVIDLWHDAPRYNPRACAYLLASMSKQLEYGDICLAVVDPGVGAADRRAVVLQADGIAYVGPDNGLFSMIARRASKLHCMEVTWRPEHISNSFHGRDLFAPVAVKLALRESVDTVEIDARSLIGYDWDQNLYEVIYIDHYGNCMTGIAESEVDRNYVLHIANAEIYYQEVFSKAQPQQPFWYINSMGLVEVALNQGDAAQHFTIQIGTACSMKPAV